MSRCPSLPRGLPVAAGALALLLAGCASGPSQNAGTPAKPRPALPTFPDRDGPEANPPPDLDQVPDAQPRLEPVRPGGPNKPYAQFGKQYVPLAGDPPFVEKGLASWYGRKFHGRPTASGELYNMYAMTAAHPTLPIPSYVRVRNPANGREVLVRVNDRGPFHNGRIIDLSYTAALKLDLLRGVRPVEIERITHEQIRTGAWRRERGEPAVVVASAGDFQPPGVTSDAGAATVVAGDTTATTPAVTAAAAAPTTPTAPDARAFTTAARGFWVQLGVFQQAAGAVQLQQQVERELDTLRPLLAIFDDRRMHRLQAGPFKTRAEAQSAATQVRELMKLVPVIVERR